MARRYGERERERIDRMLFKKNLFHRLRAVLSLRRIRTIRDKISVYMFINKIRSESRQFGHTL